MDVKFEIPENMIQYSATSKLEKATFKDKKTTIKGRNFTKKHVFVKSGSPQYYLRGNKLIRVHTGMWGKVRVTLGILTKQQKDSIKIKEI